MFPHLLMRGAGAGEFVFSLTKHGDILTERRPGSNSGGGANSICVNCGKQRAGRHLIKPEDLFWRPSNLMRIPNAEYLERPGRCVPHGPP